MEPQAKRPRSEIGGEGENPSFAEQTPPSAQESFNLQVNEPQGNPYVIAGRSRPVPLDGKGAGMQNFSSVGKPKPCMKFFSTSGCQFGESCHFLHHVPGGLSSLCMTPMVSFTAATATVLQKKTPTIIGNPSITVNGYKTKLCNRFKTPEGCRFSDRCHFAHGESELKQTHIDRANKRPMPSGPFGSAHPVGFGNIGPNFLNPNSHPVPGGNTPNFIPHGYLQTNQSVSNLTPHGYQQTNLPVSNLTSHGYQQTNPPAGNNTGSISNPTVSAGENLPVY